VRRHLEAAGVVADPQRGRHLPVPEALAVLVPDPRRRRGIRHALRAVLAVLVAGVACGLEGPAAIAQAAAGWDQDVLAAHGCRISPATGLRVPPSERTLGRFAQNTDADAVEAALSQVLAGAVLDPQVLRAAAAARRERQARKQDSAARRRRRPPAAHALRVTRGDGWVQAAPGHPFLDPAVTCDSGHVPARQAVAVDGKERKNAKAAGKPKVHMVAAVTHVTGAVLAQDKVAKRGKANETSHFKPLLDPLPLDGVAVTADAIQTTRENARWLHDDKHAFYLLPVLGNQPGLYGQLDALDWENTPVAAATADTGKGRIETRTIRVLPCPAGTGFAGAAQAVLIERYVTVKNKGQWVMRNCEAVLYITSFTADDASPADLLAHVRGHWQVEHLHWLRDLIWHEDKSLIRTGNGPQIMSALTNLVISLFRLHGVTEFAAETRANHQNPRRTLTLLDITELSPG
jgi:predicted transposase YbfD/YdcC